MNDVDRINRLRGYFHTGEFPVTTAHCLDETTVSALVDGRLEGEARARAVEHLAACALCRRAVASVTAALAHEQITHEIEVLDGRRSRFRRLVRIAAPLAAAAMLVVLLWPGPRGGIIHRGGPDQALSLIAPRGVVAAAWQWQWTSVLGADQYRLTVFDATGRVVYETQVADTVTAVPDSVRLITGQPYLWKVQARTGWDRWVASDLVEFSIARAPPQ